MVKVNYKISSRAAILLGRENVSKADGAIIELVKNSYDADASECFVIFDVVNDSIYIVDNGSGMNEDDLINKWLTIGTNNKKYDYLTKKNRIKSGEKGIGRLALDRLGTKYELYTKKRCDKTFYLMTDWTNFENDKINLDDIEVEINVVKNNFSELSSISIFNDVHLEKFEQGTVIKISGLRDTWTEKELVTIKQMLGYLLPPVEQRDFNVFYKDSINGFEKIDSLVNEEYDYKIISKFDGENFVIDLYRNEFDLNRIPDSMFENPAFKDYPYRKEDFIQKKITYNFSISKLLNCSDEKKISNVKKIGKFNFNYIFMKMQTTEKDNKIYYYKPFSKNRENWIKDNCGIKIYRDGFMVRPYGDQLLMDAFDWLGLDARKAHSPAAISHPGMGWKVRNSQGQGTLIISRVNNNEILDKSSREGIIDNESFRLLKEVLHSIISIFEKDRAYIAKNFKIIYELLNKKENIKNEGTILAESILKNERKYDNNDINKKLAETITFYKEERDELISEIKLLRSLSTNGLITTSIVHDLKTTSASMVNRVDDIKNAINLKNDNLLSLCLTSLEKSDIFLKSWINVLISQVKSDRRKRRKESLSIVVENIINNIKPILDRKNINIFFSKSFDEIYKKIFIVDFESILYNLIINSVEAFEQSSVFERKININVCYENDNFVLDYSDNAIGLSDIFKNPYDIFDFGVTSKYDKYGEKVGTGLGMYILASTVNDYNGKYELINVKNGFALKVYIPCDGEKNEREN